MVSNFPNFLILLSRTWCKETGKNDGCSVAFSRLFFCTVSSHAIMQILVSLSFSLQWSLVSHLLQVISRPISWPNEVPCWSHLQSLVVFLLWLLDTTHYSFWTASVLLNQSFFIIQIPSVSTEKLVLTHYARSVLSRFCFKSQSSVKFMFFYNWQNGESSMQRLRSFDSGHFSFYFALSCFEFYTPERSLSNSLLYSISGPGRWVPGASLSSAVPSFKKRVG